MLDLFDELKELLKILDEEQVHYALCGGLAMAVHGVARATVDIDLLVPPESLDDAARVAERAGFVLPAAPMAFAAGAVQIRRFSKVDAEGGDTLSLDLLAVTPALAVVWQDRMAVEWEGGRLWVVSPQGLVAMKKLRASGQDLDDIAALE